MQHITDKPLHHAKQMQPWGCLPLSIYAFTGDTFWLEPEQVNQVDPSYSLEVLSIKNGIKTHALYMSYAMDPADPRDWTGILENLKEPTTLQLGIRRNDINHFFTIHIDGDLVTISDSADYQLRSCSLNEFLESGYAKAWVILQPYNASLLKPLYIWEDEQATHVTMEDLMNVRREQLVTTQQEDPEHEVIPLTAEELAWEETRVNWEESKL